VGEGLGIAVGVAVAVGVGVGVGVEPDCAQYITGDSRVDRESPTKRPLSAEFTAEAAVWGAAAV
jgi:hypothetical protein